MNIIISETPIDSQDVRNKNTLRIFYTFLNGSDNVFRVISKIDGQSKIEGQFTCKSDEVSMTRTFKKAEDRYNKVKSDLEKDDNKKGEIICYAPVSYAPLVEAHQAKIIETPNGENGEQIEVAPEFVHLRKFKANIRNMIKIKGFDYAENMLNEFESVLKEEKALEEERRAEEEAKVEKTQEAMAFLEEKGLSIEDLLQASAMLKKQKA